MEKRFAVNKLQNLMTKWPAWYAIIPFFAMLASSLIVQFLPSIGTLSIPLQFLLLAGLSIGIVWFLQKKRVSKSDLGLDNDINKRSLLIIISVFIVTHLLFFLLAKIGNVTSDASAEFISFGFGKGFLSDLVIILSVTILAPICEEIAYRGVMLRSLHDWFTRIFKKKTPHLFSLPVILAITLTAIAFVLPHVSDITLNVIVVSYFISSIGFSLVYVMTRSLPAAMVSHALQSCYAFSIMLIVGHGAYNISPIIYAVALLCPVIVYFLAKWLRRI